MTVSRRGILRGLAGITGGALAGRYVVEQPGGVIETASLSLSDLALPLREIVVPEAPQIVLAKGLSAHVAALEMTVDSWALGQKAEANRLLYSELTLRGTITEFDGWMRHGSSARRLRIYAEVVEDA